MCLINNLLPFHTKMEHITTILILTIIFMKVSNAYRVRKVTELDSSSSFLGFKCSSGQYISEDDECDGKVDCDDGSDETTSCLRLQCPGFLFRCTYGACINPELECDGKRDCRDSADETSRNCIKTQCRFDEFPCQSGDECVSAIEKCDGKTQCTDYSDESRESCENITCPRSSFRCSYGACITNNLKCDGKADCHDGSDEFPNICDANSMYKPPNSIFNLNVFFIINKS